MVLQKIFKFPLRFPILFTIHIVGEINGNRHPDRNEPKEPRTAFLGITYKLSERLTFDTAIRRGLTSSAPDWRVTIGVSINF